MCFLYIQHANTQCTCKGIPAGCYYSYNAKCYFSKQFKKFMLTAWLLCKHSSWGISSLLSLLPDTKFSDCETIPTTEDLSLLDSYLKEEVYQITSTKQWLTSHDILYLVWNLLSSVLTIKHIGGIIYVANAITLILQRLTHIANQSVFIAR